MLNTMRKYASGWVAQIFIVLLIVSFGVWGVAGALTGIGGNYVAQVGSTEISAVSFDRAYRRELQNLSRQLGQQVTPDQARAFGLPNQVLGRLVTEAALDDQANTLSLGVSQDTLVREIAHDPAFNGPSGTFDRAYFVELLRSNGLNEDDYVLERQAVEKRKQIADSISGGATVPVALSQALHTYQTQARTIRYIVMPTTLVTDVAAPNQDELTAYYNDNKANWRAPELRTISILKMTPADVSRPEDITDADAQKYYDANAAQFTTPETRHVFQFVFTDASTAKATADQIKGGETFEAALTAAGKQISDADLGVVTKDKLIDPAVADAAFALAPNATSDVIAGSFGPVIVHVTDVSPASVKPFDSVKDEIKKTLALTAARNDMANLRDSIEDARAGGATLDEIAKNNKLTVQTISVDQSGKDASGNAVADIPVQAALLKAAFESDVGIDNAALQTDDGGTVWFNVTDISPAHDRPLDEVKDKVAAAWTKATIADRLAAKAKEAKERLAKGETLDAVAASFNLPVVTAQKLTRGTKPPADLSVDALKAAFAGPVGTAAAVPGPNDGDQIVLQVEAIDDTPYLANDASRAALTQQLADAMQNDLLQQYVTELQNELGATVNQTKLQQVIGAS
ncbi:SurA N-terminal domain-containing protein [Kaistia dalseonensis]|uniref:Parvulin-like PPIase n=1 Tax=Kaistia dalseonensis TaxID=410840 RepID=A0ABU0H381_9HYPH|nr:peptidylprolyl isomerase [Kaistia dalseonensis]MCX5494179.1 SurA N-terminal domain-containing protein [Kaistia dalseonensis]MDQ0436758.1 peptidyl-prolyl cis-trans isomerase D [Kaistia dalseonensis]